MSILPDFKLETYFSRWEFNTKYNLCASDTESLSLDFLLNNCTEEDKNRLKGMRFGYTETYGSKILRESIANTYDRGSYKDILTFAGAEEGIYVAMKSILSKNDHAIIITPNYQSAETIPSSICDVTAIDLEPNQNGLTNNMYKSTDNYRKVFEDDIEYDRFFQDWVDMLTLSSGVTFYRVKPDSGYIPNALKRGAMKHITWNSFCTKVKSLRRAVA